MLASHSLNSYWQFVTDPDDRGVVARGLHGGWPGYPFAIRVGGACRRR